MSGPPRPIAASAPANVIIGTRGSQLARWQASDIQERLQQLWPGIRSELLIIKPEGDLDKTSPLTTIGGRGVFSSALQTALLVGAIDLAVHSTKDVPTLFPPGSAIQAFPVRHDSRDAVISRHGAGILDLPRAPRIGTASRRRAVQLLAMRPDAEIVEIRGNIDTRLRKAESEPFDAVILAAAGLERMGWAERIVEFLALDVCTPSPGQGALAVESRIAPDPFAAFAQALDDPAVSTSVELERSFLQSIGGGCTTPVGAHAELETVHGRTLVRFWAMLASEDGERLARRYEEFTADGATDTIREIARTMIDDIRRVVVAVPGVDDVIAGRTVLTTCTGRLARALGTEIGRFGALHLHQPTIVIEPVEDQPGPGSDAPDWFVITSGHAIPALAAAVASQPGQRRSRVAVVGKRTRELAEQAGLTVDLVPADQRGDGLVNAFAAMDLAGKSVHLLVGDRAGTALGASLTDQGAVVSTAIVYRTVAVPAARPQVMSSVQAGDVAVVIFASPTAVRSFVTMIDQHLPALSGACLVAIGPTTADAMDRLDLPPHIVASRPDPVTVVSEIRAYFGATDDSPIHLDKA